MVDEPREQRVYIIRVSTGGNGVEYRVRPAVCVLRPGDVFTVRNMTDLDWDVTLSNDLAGARPMPMPHAGAALPHATPTVISVTIPPGTPAGCYPYSVGLANNPFPVTANGESEPVMIIDP